MQLEHANLSLSILSANLHALTTHVRGTEEQPDFSRVRGRASGEIVAAGITDLFSEQPFAFMAEALRKTHLSYHSLRDRLLQRDIIALQTYVTQGCEGEVVDLKEILGHRDEVSNFCIGTRAFFNNVPLVPGLKGVFNTYFCNHCTENGRLIQNYFQLFLLQRDYGSGLPYTALAYPVRHKKMGDVLDLFLIEVQKSKVSTSVLHRGLDCFLAIHRHLFPEQTAINDVSEIEFALQNRRLMLQKSGKVAKTSFSLFMEADSEQLSWRRSLKQGDRIVINEGAGNDWVKTEVTLGELIGRNRGDEDRFIHFRVTRVRECRTPSDRAKDLLIIGERDERWNELPGEYVMTIPFNRAILGLKRLIGQSIGRAELNFSHNCARLAPLLSLRQDEQGGCALFPLLGPLPEEKKEAFAAEWISKLDLMSYMPHPLPDFSRILYGSITIDGVATKVVCYPRNLRTRPKDAALMERFKQAIRDHYGIAQEPAAPALP